MASHPPAHPRHALKYRRAVKCHVGHGPVWERLTVLREQGQRFQPDKPHASGLSSKMPMSRTKSSGPNLMQLMLDPACEQMYFGVSDALTSSSLSSLVRSDTSALSSPSCRLWVQHRNLQDQTPDVAPSGGRQLHSGCQPYTTAACTPPLCRPIVCPSTCNSTDVIFPTPCLSSSWSC